MVATHVSSKVRSKRKATRGTAARTQVMASKRDADGAFAALQARVGEALQREWSFVDHPSFRGMDAESDQEAIVSARGLTARGAVSDLPEKLPAHLRRLCEVPLLSAAEERELFRRMNFLLFRANVIRSRLRVDSPNADELDRVHELLVGANEIRNYIVQANMRLVMSIVKHYISDANSFDDLLSEGAAALMRAAEKFDFSRGFRFSTYVTKVVRREVFRMVMAQKKQSDRFATGAVDLLASQADGDSTDLDNAFDVSSLRGDLLEFFQKLDPREQFVLSERFGMTGDDKAPSLNDLGRRMGVSKERVRQLELRAIRKLQKAFHGRSQERRMALQSA